MKKDYVTPLSEVIEIEIEDAILADGGSGPGGFGIMGEGNGYGDEFSISSDIFGI